MATVVARSSYERGNESYSRGAYDDAIERYTDALESLAIDDELRARCLANRAQCWAQLREPARAAADCDAVLARDPSNLKARARRMLARASVPSCAPRREVGSRNEIAGEVITSSIHVAAPGSPRIADPQPRPAANRWPSPTSRALKRASE